MMAQTDPVTGPVSREEFQRLVDAPFGAAAKAIREHDPEWGRRHPEPGEKVKWSVRMEREVTEYGYLIVEAESADAALDAAAAMQDPRFTTTDIEDRFASWDAVTAEFTR